MIRTRGQDGWCSLCPLPPLPSPLPQFKSSCLQKGAFLSLLQSPTSQTQGRGESGGLHSSESSSFRGEKPNGEERGQSFRSCAKQKRRPMFQATFSTGLQGRACRQTGGREGKGRLSCSAQTGFPYIAMPSKGKLLSPATPLR